MIYWVSADIFDRKEEIPDDFWMFAARANKEIEKRGISSDLDAVNSLWKVVCEGRFPEVQRKRFIATFNPGEGAEWFGPLSLASMTCEIRDHNDDFHRLYAEEAIPEGVSAEDFAVQAYPRLKAEIIRQASALGVDESYLAFE